VRRSRRAGNLRHWRRGHENPAIWESCIFRYSFVDEEDLTAGKTINPPIRKPKYPMSGGTATGTTQFEGEGGKENSFQGKKVVREHLKFRYNSYLRLG